MFARVLEARRKTPACLPAAPGVGGGDLRQCDHNAQRRQLDGFRDFGQYASRLTFMGCDVFNDRMRFISAEVLVWQHRCWLIPAQ